MLSVIVGKKQGRLPGPGEFGKLIRAKRIAEHLDIRDAAEKIGIGHGGLSELENGRSPSRETIVKIHLAFQIPLDDLMRAAAKDEGIDIPDRTDEELITALTKRASTSPDLLKVLRRLEKVDPEGYRWFLMAADLLDRQQEQEHEVRS